MSKHSETNIYPKISIIIPYQDNLEEVTEMLTSLENQTYELENVEVLLINNSSNDKLIADSNPIQRKFQVQFLEEKEYLNSPYSARNRGVEAARGDIIVFIDANSSPDKSWLENGVRFLVEKNYDLVGGRVNFDFGERLTAAKVVDSLTSINMKKAVEERGVAYTANLFVKKEVFKSVGIFEEKTRSGGDVRFTSNAVQSGFTIGYCESSLVMKKARSYRELYYKKLRTGRGYFYTWRMDDERRVWFYNFLRALKPPSLENYNLSDHRVNRFSVWLHLYLVGITEQIAFMSEYFRYNLGSRIDRDRRKEMMNRKTEEV